MRLGILCLASKPDSKPRFIFNLNSKPNIILRYIMESKKYLVLELMLEVIQISHLRLALGLEYR